LSSSKDPEFISIEDDSCAHALCWHIFDHFREHLLGLLPLVGGKVEEQDLVGRFEVSVNILG